MKAMYPDILDAMGKPPMEIGTLQVHAETIQLFDTGRYIATVLVQAAFEPTRPARLRIVSNVGEELALLDMPPLARGAAVRLFIPFKGPSDLLNAALQVECAEAKSAGDRVREPWRLTDANESPKLSELNPLPLESFSEEGLRLAAAPLNSAVEWLTKKPTPTVTPSRRAVPNLVLWKTSGLAAPRSSVEVEVLWRPT